MRFFYKICLILLIIGGVNWGLVGLFSFDLIGWLFGGMIVGLNKARLHGGVKAVCQVGMGPEMPALEGIARKKNFLPFKKVPVFYFQGAFNLNKLPLPLKLIMKKKTQEIAAGLALKSSRSAQEQARRPGDQWTEVRHCADAEKDQRRIDPQLDALI